VRPGGRVVVDYQHAAGRWQRTELAQLPGRVV
jgi:hypothetical protein